jgi:hypothetical protein
MPGMTEKEEKKKPRIFPNVIFPMKKHENMYHKN